MAQPIWIRYRWLNGELRSIGSGRGAAHWSWRRAKSRSKQPWMQCDQHLSS
ncbi:rCG61918 [Rattus norvegicus]|uniref:RCG61918 n=1 Tax=Rattus norvegicus TaxID=10116 RepID=A6HAM0_RAT|nr:rCG61918 [Rattus norvegicus]